MISFLLVTSKPPTLTPKAPFDSIWVEELDGFFAVLGELPDSFLSTEKETAKTPISPNSFATGETWTTSRESEEKSEPENSGEEELALEQLRLISVLRAHHATVWECFRQDHRVLPIRFGAGFSSKVSALSHIKTMFAPLASALAQVVNCTEWRLDAVVSAPADDQAIDTLPYLKRKAALREQKQVARQIAEDFQGAISHHLSQQSDLAFRFASLDGSNALGRVEFLLPCGPEGERQMGALERFIDEQIGNGRFPRSLKCDLHGPSPVFSFAESFLGESIVQANEAQDLARKSTQGGRIQDAHQ